MAITRIAIKQGEALRLDLKVRNQDTNALIDFSTGFTARMQIRQNEQDTVIRDDLDTGEITSGNGRITLGDGVPPTGSTETEVANVVLVWDTAASALLDLFTGRGVEETYLGVADLEIKDSSGEVNTSIRLEFAQTREVTI